MTEKAELSERDAVIVRVNMSLMTARRTVSKVRSVLMIRNIDPGTKVTRLQEAIKALETAANRLPQRGTKDEVLARTDANAAREEIAELLHGLKDRLGSFKNAQPKQPARVTHLKLIANAASKKRTFGEPRSRKAS